MLSLAGKTAIVTGASSGIGLATAQAFAALGARVAVGARRAERLPQGDAFVPLPLDVLDKESCATFVDRAVAELGGLDIAINNAGVLAVSTVEEMAEETYDFVMDVNVKGVFLSCKAELPVLRAAGWGRIVNVASVAGKQGYQGLSAYCASKFAVIGFTNSLAKEVAREGITVNAICPGIIGTDMWLGDKGLARALQQPGETEEQSWQRSLAANIPQGVAQTPEDMGDLAVFFCTADHVTGQAWNVDGGFAM